MMKIKEYLLPLRLPPQQRSRSVWLDHLGQRSAPAGGHAPHLLKIGQWVSTPRCHLWWVFLLFPLEGGVHNFVEILIRISSCNFSNIIMYESFLTFYFSVYLFIQLLIYISHLEYSLEETIQSRKVSSIPCPYFWAGSSCALLA